jgi:hypothetical protein
MKRDTEKRQIIGISKSEEAGLTTASEPTHQPRRKPRQVNSAGYLLVSLVAWNSEPKSNR